MSSPQPYFWSDTAKHPDTPIRIAVYQPVSTNSDVQHNILLLKHAATLAAQQHAHVIVTPELFLTGYDVTRESVLSSALTHDSPEISAVRSIAQSNTIAMVIGYTERDSVELTRLYNSAMVVDNDGSIRSNYRKTHLWQTVERSIWSAGAAEEYEVFSLNAFPALKFGSAICYDIEFPEPARVLTLKGMNVFFVITALCTSATNHLVSACVLPTRAMENHVFIAYSNFTQSVEATTSLPTPLHFCGLSGIYAPDGISLARAGTETALLIAECPTKRYIADFHRTPYLLDRRIDCYADGILHRHIPIDYTLVPLQVATQQHDDYQRQQLEARRNGLLQVSLVTNISAKEETQAKFVKNAVKL